MTIFWIGVAWVPDSRDLKVIAIGSCTLHFGRQIIFRQGIIDGGGNLFRFSIADFSLAAASPACDWTAMETWQG